jgi:PAS domain S-box-containing protein
VEQSADRAFSDLLESNPEAAVCAAQQGQLATANAAQLAAIVESSPVAVLGQSVGGIITSWNPAAERLYGYRASEIVGQHISVLIPAADRQRELEILGSVARGRRLEAHQAQRVRKDGSPVSVSLTLSPITDSAGKITGLCALARHLSRERDDPRFTGLLEAAPDAMICVDGSGRIVLANAQAERLFGYAKEELTGQPVDMLVPDQARHRHPAHRAEYLASPRPRPMGAGMDLAVRRKDGSTFPAEISLSAIHTEEGILITAAVRDITDRRRAAEATARLAAIIESSHDAVIGKTPDGLITSWNPAAERLYGYRSEEIVGRHYDVLIPPEHRAQEAAIHRRVTRDGQVQAYEAPRRRKDGTTATVSIVLSPITDDTGAITGMSSIVRDLTERQRADAKFTALLEAAPDAMVCVADDGRIALVNAQAERLFGYRRQELIGQPPEILVPEQVRAELPALGAKWAADALSQPTSAGAELTALRQDGSTFPAEITLSAIQTNEGVLYTAVVRDITERLESQAERERLIARAERERLERQVHQSRRLESLGQLAGGVAHDFNNLLGVITGYTAIIKEEVAAAEPAGPWQPVLAHLEQVQHAAKHGAGLTRQLLAFARQEVVKPRTLILNSVVAGMQELLIRTLGEHIELVTDLDPGLRPVLADPGQIEQVLVNLAVNARDAMPGGGRLTIETINLSAAMPALPGPAVLVRDGEAPDRPDGLPAGEYVLLKVSDTGTGIPKDIIDRVFEPFFTTKAQGHGTGLGLATVYGVITQAGGQLRISSEPGSGTTVVAILPVNDQDTAGSAELAAEPAPGRGETVLLVEDEAALREATRQILTRHGYRVLAAANGPEALAILGEHQGQVQVLLTDVVMPQMPGKQLADKVQAAHPSIQVLFMSGYTQGLLSAQGVLDQDVRLIEKPFDQATLLSKLNEALRAQRGA